MNELIEYKLEKNVGSIFFPLIIIQTMIFIFFFPNMESPDFFYHIEKLFGNVGYDKQFYFIAMNFVKRNVEAIFSQLPNFEYSLTGIREYFSLKSIAEYPSGNNSLIMFFQLINLLMVTVSIIFFNLMLKYDKKVVEGNKNVFRSINYLYFLYPQTAYLITIISPDFFNYLIQPLFLYLIYTRRHIVNFSILIIMYIYIDEGIVTNIIFLILFLLCHYLFKIYKAENRYIYMIILFVCIFILFYFSRNILYRFSNTNELISLSVNLIENNGTFVTKIINMLLSSFSFWGIGNFITFPINYVIYIYVLISIFIFALRSKGKIGKSFFELCYVLLITVMIILIFYGTHSNVRFFMFWIPIFLMGFLIFKNNFRVLKNINIYYLAIIFFYHNVLLVMFYSIKILM